MFCCDCRVVVSANLVLLFFSLQMVGWDDEETIEVEMTRCLWDAEVMRWVLDGLGSALRPDGI